METKQLIFLAASILMLKDDESHRNIINASSHETFKDKFKIYQSLLEELYGSVLSTQKK